MRRSIGLRATTNRVWFSVIELSESGMLELLVANSLPFPAALSPPNQLRFVRQAIADTISEYRVVVAGIRLAEPVARKPPPRSRLHVEGVIQELLASSTVEAYFYGPIASMARLLEEPTKAIKRYVAGDPFRDVRGWTERKPQQRESILVAVAAHSRKLS